MNYFYVHVGLHKTGTTALQTDIFPKIHGVRYVGRYTGSSVYGDDLYEDIIRFSFLGNMKTLNQSLVRNKIEKALHQSNILISEEWFTSDFDFYSTGRGARWQEKIYRLAILLRGLPVKIIVTTREPIEAMSSMYCELLQAGEAKQYDSFYHFAVCDNSALAYRSEYLNSLLVSAFGVNPLYIDIAELKNRQFHVKLSELFGVKVPDKLKKHNTKTQNERGVEIVSSNSIYRVIRGLWLRVPLWLRKSLSDRAYQTIRRNLRSRYSSKSVIPNPSAEEIMAVKQLLNTRK